MKNGELVSRVLNALNSIHKDNKIRKRYVLNVAKQKGEFLLSQKLDDKTLYREDNLYTTVDCLELIPIPPIKCDIIEFRRCRSIMRSKDKLPKLIYSKYGNSIKDITSLDDENEFKPTTPQQFRRDNQRSIKSDYTHFYVKNGYLYLLDSEVLRVTLTVLTLENDKIESCDKECDDCKSVWDFDFIVSDKIAEAVVQDTIKEVGMRFSIKADENPNLDING